MSQLPQRLGFDLTNPFSGNTKLLANLFKGTGTAIVHPEAQTKYILFALCKCIEYLLKLLFKQLVSSSLSRSRCIMILNKVAQIGVILLADWRFKRYRLLSNLHNLAYFIRC
ncbi:hypothetical protein D3C80_1633070 [compost metagenome]